MGTTLDNRSEGQTVPDVYRRNVLKFSTLSSGSGAPQLSSPIASTDVHQTCSPV